MKIKRIFTLFIELIFISITIFGYFDSQKAKQQENEAIQLAKTIKLKEVAPTTLGKGMITKVDDKAKGYEDFHVQLDNGKKMEFTYNSDNKSYDNDSSDDKFDYAQYDGPLNVGQKIEITRKNYQVVGKVKEFKNISHRAKDDIFLNAVLDSTDEKIRDGIHINSPLKPTNSKEEISRAFNLVNSNSQPDVFPEIKAIK